MHETAGAPPLMATDWDNKRCEHLALRSRMLSGRWLPDLERALNKHISPDRRAQWGLPEPSRNPFASVTKQLGGVLYTQPPAISGNGADQKLLGPVADAGLWNLMQRFSTDLVGLRENVMRVDGSPAHPLQYRRVAPWLSRAEASIEQPDVPTLLQEAQVRAHPDNGKPTWVWETLDVRDPDAPIHTIVSGDRKQDWTTHYLGGPRFSHAYQYRLTQGPDKGWPYIPAVLYHAERTGELWDSWYGVEAVLGSLTTGVLLTFWVHGVKDGSFATVLLVGGTVAGLEIKGPGGQSRRQVISAEPGSLIEVAPMEEGVQPTAIQLRPGFEPDKLMSAISMFEGGLAEYAGVSPADLVRTGADPRSGISLTVSREGLRAAQARFEPQLRRGDQQLLAVSARVINQQAGTRFAENPGDYALSYPSLPLSAGELQSVRSDIREKVEMGLMSKVDAYIKLHPGTPREQAIAELRRIQSENAMFPGATII